jgi:hypothetical protein
MRNWASAAHPNQNELTGLQLADWLETCIREVLAKEPSDAAIIVKKLLKNIREETFDQSSAMPIKAKIQKLPKELSGSLLRSIFGMYVDEKLSLNIKRNIDLISKSAWNQTDDNDKSEIGLRHAFYAVNGDLKRKELATKFLTNVDGLRYLSEDIKAVEIKEKIDNLRNAHEGYQNFYNEEPHARILFNYIHETGEIPESIAFEYAKTLIICRVGNRFGVSRSAEPYYSEMIRIFQDDLIKIFLNLLKDEEILNILEDDTRLLRFVKIAKQLEIQTSDLIIKKSLKKLIDGKKEDIISKKTYDAIKILLNLR